MNEHQIQKLAVAALRKIGFTCCVTSNRKKTSNTKGMPDVFVHIRNGFWIGLEFKQPKGKVSKEQSRLNITCHSYIVSSIESAMDICLTTRNGWRTRERN